MPLRRDPLLDRLKPLHKLRRHPALGYGVAVVSVIAATLVRSSFPGLFSSAAFATYFFAVVVTALLGTFRAGLLSVALSMVAMRYFFMAPPHSFALTTREAIALTLAAATFTLVAAGLSTLQELIDRLWQQEDDLRSVLDAQPVGVAVVDETGSVIFANDTIEKQFGFPPDGIAGRQIGPLLPDAMPEIHALYHARRKSTAHEMYAIRRNGTQFPAEITLAPLVRAGRHSILLTVTDITERRIVERSQQVFAREVQHRARNVLAMVQAITARTLTPDRPAAEARDALLSTLSSFARTHEAVMSGGGVTLKSIVEREIGAFPGAVSVHGSDLRLSAAAAMNLSLIVHELCTNAAKYGALSVPGGKVLMEWQTTNGVLALSWIELDGPKVHAPGKSGFGSTLLHDVPKTWGADARSEFSPQGLIYSLLVDEQSVAEKAEISDARVA